MKLYKHQEEALERTKNFNRVAYYHEMGVRQNIYRFWKNANVKQQRQFDHLPKVKSGGLGKTLWRKYAYRICSFWSNK